MRSAGWDPAVAELTEYFRTTESVNGLSSSWEPLVGIAQGGAVVRTDPEAKFLAGGRFALGPNWNTAVSRHREVRLTLLRLTDLSPGALDVLWAAYGSVPWARVIDAGLGAGMSQKVAEHLDPRLFGVALLTPEFREGTRDWAGPVALRADDHRASHPAWRTPGAWLVDLVLVSKSRGKRVSEERRSNALALLSEVGRSAAGMLRGAEDAYRGAQQDERARTMHVARGTGPKPRRTRVLDALAEIDFDGGERR